MQQYVLDRVEGSYAVMEDEKGTLNNVSLMCLKGEIKEGNLYIKNDELFIYNEELTKIRKAEINSITKDIWR